MQVIQHIELGSTQSTITFSSIDQSFNDLLLIMSIRTTRTTSDGLDPLVIKLNGDVADCTGVAKYDAGLVTGGGANAPFRYHASNSTTTANSFGPGLFYLREYTVSPKAKVGTIFGACVNNVASGAWGFEYLIGESKTTAAVTTIELSSGTGQSLVSGSSATLYGITNGTSNITVS